jgi:hypothetical protein
MRQRRVEALHLRGAAQEGVHCGHEQPAQNEVSATDSGRETPLSVTAGYVLSDRCAAKPIRVKRATESATRLVRAVETEPTGESTL